jgi:hypothetical protein
MKNSDFIKRFIEVCGTSQAGIICQKFDISYQAAKNYLQGRIPEVNVLIYLSKETSYSIHWILTGEGKKFIEPGQTEDTLPVSDEMRAFIRRECLEIINEILHVGYQRLAGQKVVALSSVNIKQEKVTEEKTVTKTAE